MFDGFTIVQIERRPISILIGTKDILFTLISLAQQVSTLDKNEWNIEMSMIVNLTAHLFDTLIFLHSNKRSFCSMINFPLNRTLFRQGSKFALFSSLMNQNSLGLFFQKKIFFLSQKQKKEKLVHRSPSEFYCVLPLGAVVEIGFVRASSGSRIALRIFSNFSYSASFGSGASWPFFTLGFLRKFGDNFIEIMFPRSSPTKMIG